jgi:coenzyme F420-0:L-glutamate ligase / coenzyme F420-1:gamma-L-glutamate ligase
MSDFIGNLRSRRSIRTYTEQPVSMGLVRELLETAVYAPSAHNAQPWRFIVLNEENQKHDLADTMGQVWMAELERDHIPKNVRWATVNASVERFANAPVLILACLTLEDMEKYLDAERQRTERDLAVQSLAAAVQTLLLTAHAEGLGACWFCAPIFCKLAVREALGIPEEVEPQALITLGYPAEKPKPPERYPLDAVAFLGKWNNPLHEQAENPER